MDNPALQWVFVHGAGGSSAFWELVRPFFPGAWFVDLPGHETGHPATPRSPVPTSAATGERLEQYAEWLQRRIESEGRRQVVLVGHSMGGACAQLLGQSRPAWLSALVLSATAAHFPISPELLRHLQDDYSAAVDWVIDNGFASPPSRYRREGIRRQMLRIPRPVTEADYRACQEFDSRPTLLQGALRIPSLVVCGRADTITPLSWSEFLAAHIPGARLAVLPDAGHFAPVERPAQWSKAVLSQVDGLMAPDSVSD